MGELSEEDTWMSSSPNQFQRQFSDAIALVLRDADAFLGEGIVTHVIDDDEERFLREIGPTSKDHPGN